jgi:adenosylmethionine-8-amino-7-oxononanoate aminotransferase
MQEALRRGVLLLPEGEHSEITGITPPLTLSEAQLDRAFCTITEAVEHLVRPSAMPAPAPRVGIPRRTPSKNRRR